MHYQQCFNFVNSTLFITWKNYVVEEIVDKHLPDDGTALYLVKWEGYSNADNTWEPIESFYGSMDLVTQFESNLRNSHRENRGVNQTDSEGTSMMVHKNDGADIYNVDEYSMGDGEEDDFDDDAMSEESSKESDDGDESSAEKENYDYDEVPTEEGNETPKDETNNKDTSERVCHSLFNILRFWIMVRQVGSLRCIRFSVFFRERNHRQDLAKSTSKARERSNFACVRYT